MRKRNGVLPFVRPLSISPQRVWHTVTSTQRKRGPARNLRHAGPLHLRGGRGRIPQHRGGHQSHGGAGAYKTAALVRVKKNARSGGVRCPMSRIQKSDTQLASAILTTAPTPMRERPNRMSGKTSAAWRQPAGPGGDACPGGNPKDNGRTGSCTEPDCFEHCGADADYDDTDGQDCQPAPHPGTCEICGYGYRHHKSASFRPCRP